MATAITRDLLKALRIEIDQALQDIGTKYGVAEDAIGNRWEYDVLGGDA